MGINKNNLNFVWLVILAQIILFVGQTGMELFRNWILVHMGSRININLISDFLIKLMRLPVRFFDARLTGDILQRITDNQRIEQFLASTSLKSIFSIFTIIVFGIVLAIYHQFIFLIFLFGTILYIAWLLIFLQRRRELDHKRFYQEAESQSKLIQIVEGIKDIKGHNAERTMRWAWERTQANLFRVKLDYLQIEQWQRMGAAFINELKNIIITLVAADAVIDGDLTLGMMLAILYIIGQLNAPVDQLLRFSQSAQEAKISLERMNEVHLEVNEEAPEDKINVLPAIEDISIEHVSFHYNGPGSTPVLQNINLTIPKGKTTAIVGISGSGKTTLLKLLLHYYQPTAGKIKIGRFDLANVRVRTWRDKCGFVLQDSYIFSDTIARNIALGAGDKINGERLFFAARIAQIHPFINSLPLKYNTKIGNDGIDLSQGQLQRILIARLVYKNPDYIFLDEATNSLDAYSEMMVLDSLEEFLAEKTVVVVAHRLSTVQNADKIVVLQDGEVVEEGTHSSLIDKKGAYYFLIKNQLSVG